MCHRLPLPLFVSSTDTAAIATESASVTSPGVRSMLLAPINSSPGCAAPFPTHFASCRPGLSSSYHCRRRPPHQAGRRRSPAFTDETPLVSSPGSPFSPRVLPMSNGGRSRRFNQCRRGRLLSSHGTAVPINAGNNTLSLPCPI